MTLPQLAFIVVVASAAGLLELGRHRFEQWRMRNRRR